MSYLIAHIIFVLLSFPGSDNYQDDYDIDFSFLFSWGGDEFPTDEYWYYDFWSQTSPGNFEDYLDGLGENFLNSIHYLNPTLEELRTLGHKKEDFIRECRFNGRNCSYL